jgi:predicted Zn-dependent protease
MQRLTKSLVALAVFAYLATTTVQAANINLPDLGDASATSISPAQERKLGEDFMRRARGALAIMDDPEISEYIQTLGRKLVAGTDNPAQDFYFFVVDDPTINAFAVPGGFVGVHTGLISAAQSEAELASVMAHEITHVTQRHIPRLIAEQERATLPAMAAILASILLAGAGKNVGEAGIALTSATMAQRGLNFTRSFEEEADRIGMGLLANAGFNPYAMPAFFERMQAANRLNESNLPEFLRTHPVTSNRIAEARSRAERLTAQDRPDSSEFQHVRAKLRARARGVATDEIVRGFRDNLAQGRYRDADAERYGYALALLHDKQVAAARAEMGKLIAAQPTRVNYRIAQAEIEMAAGNQSEALAIYRAAHRERPASVMLTRQYADALLRAGKAADARSLLKEALRTTSDDPALYKMLATAAGETGAKVEAHQAQAEYYYLMGNPAAAIEQLRIASRYAGDSFYLQSSLEARIAEIRQDAGLAESKPAAKQP